MRKWNRINKNEANEIMLQWEDIPIARYDKTDEPLRSDLVSIMTKTIDELDIGVDEIQKNGYNYDLAYGLKLYLILKNKYGMTDRIASDDSVWRYLSLCVAPDVVYHRWGLNPPRFWKEPRRIWLKSIWWYVHLSWQGDEETTRRTLEKNTTDEVVQLVERSGQNGYRVDLYRQIMKYYGDKVSGNNASKRGLFRKAMKLNTAWIKTIEPALKDGGEEEYVKELFGYFEKGK